MVCEIECHRRHAPSMAGGHQPWPCQAASRTRLGLPHPALLGCRITRIPAMFLRALFFGALVAVTVRLSSPQSETIWTDLIRLAVGFGVCLWIVIHVSQDGRRIQGLGLSRPSNDH